MDPAGEIVVTCAGGSATVNVRATDHCPKPAAFLARTQNVWFPDDNTVLGVIEHAPDPPAQPAEAAECVEPITCVEPRFTHSSY